MANHNDERRSKAKEILKGAGYGSMKHLVEKGVGEHEGAMHKGKKKTPLHLATGGCASGGEPKARMDRKPRASGGRNKHKEPKVSVNVINAGGKQNPPMMPPPAMAHPPMPAPAPMAPQKPPMAAPQGMPPGGMPPGAMGMKPPGMMNSGGRAKKAGGGPVASKGTDVPHLKSGAGGGMGRLLKAKHEQDRK